jgi:hypothetical protein
MAKTPRCRNFKRRTTETNTLHDTSAVVRVARTTRWLIYGLATLLTLVFGWLKLNGQDFAPIVKDLTPSLLFRTSLALYFTSWAFGTTSDTNVQESVYAVAPASGSLPMGAWSIAISISLVFAILCVVKSVGIFSLVLALLLTANVVGWRYMLKLVADPLSRSAEEYESCQDYAKLQELREVARYLSGGWQWWRFGAGAIIIGAMLALAFEQVSLRVGFLFGLPSTEYAFSVLVFAFVAIMEGWIWAIRLQRNITIDVIRKINALYRLSPRTD